MQGKCEVVLSAETPIDKRPWPDRAQTPSFVNNARNGRLQVVKDLKVNRPG